MVEALDRMLDQLRRDGAWAPALAVVVVVVSAVLLMWIPPWDTTGVYGLSVKGQNLRKMPDIGVVANPSESDGDFDGDGVVDRLATMIGDEEGLFGRTGVGIVELRCGRSGLVLLDTVVDSILLPAEWCGDVDGNGTDDVRIRDSGQRYVLGMRRQQVTSK